MSDGIYNVISAAIAMRAKNPKITHDAFVHHMGKIASHIYHIASELQMLDSGDMSDHLVIHDINSGNTSSSTLLTLSPTTQTFTNGETHSRTTLSSDLPVLHNNHQNGNSQQAVTRTVNSSTHPTSIVATAQTLQSQTTPQGATIDPNHVEGINHNTVQSNAMNVDTLTPTSTSQNNHNIVRSSPLPTTSLVKKTTSTAPSQSDQINKQQKPTSGVVTMTASGSVNHPNQQQQQQQAKSTQPSSIIPVSPKKSNPTSNSDGSKKDNHDNHMDIDEGVIASTNTTIATTTVSSDSASDLASKKKKGCKSHNEVVEGIKDFRKQFAPEGRLDLPEGFEAYANLIKRIDNDLKIYYLNPEGNKGIMRTLNKIVKEYTKAYEKYTAKRVKREAKAAMSEPAKKKKMTKPVDNSPNSTITTTTTPFSSSQSSSMIATATVMSPTKTSSGPAKSTTKPVQQQSLPQQQQASTLIETTPLISISSLSTNGKSNNLNAINNSSSSSSITSDLISKVVASSSSSLNVKSPNTTTHVSSLITNESSSAPSLPSKSTSGNNQSTNGVAPQKESSTMNSSNILMMKPPQTPGTPASTSFNHDTNFFK